MNEIQVSVKNASIAAKQWFMNNSVRKSRREYLARGQLGDKGYGAVYVYYDGNAAVYVGQTKRPIKRRMHDQLSSHKTRRWWKKWTVVRFVNIENETDRITLELLLILSYKDVRNVKPKPMPFGKMFKI